VVGEAAVDRSMARWIRFSSKVDTDSAVQLLALRQFGERLFREKPLPSRRDNLERLVTNDQVDLPADRDNFRDNPGDNRLPVTAVVVYA
jgi:hypothetical protein